MLCSGVPPPVDVLGSTPEGHRVLLQRAIGAHGQLAGTTCPAISGLDQERKAPCRGRGVVHASEERGSRTVHTAAAPAAAHAAPRKQRRRPHSAKRGPGRSKESLRSSASAQPATAESISLPINYFEMLQVTPEASRDAVELMCASKLKVPPAEGFSANALAARAQILEAARDTLLDEFLRAGYTADLKDAQIRNPDVNAVTVDVPLAQAPGLLCLLQEAGGRAAIVAEAGLALLASWDPRDTTGRRDLALTTALAYADLSRESVTATPPAVTQGCELLEAALAMLTDEGGSDFSPELQQSIRSSLSQLGPTRLLEALALPVGPENEAARQEGLQGMRDLMWTKQDGKLASKVGGFSREVFMRECFLRMTTSELVDFFGAAPADVDAGLVEVYWVALAYLGRAFFYRRPQDVLQGEALLGELEGSLSFQALASLNGSRERARISAGAMLPGTDVPASLSMERAMCALLLGRVDDAKRRLGLPADGAPPLSCPPALPSGDLAVAQFVYSNSPGVPPAWTQQLEACLQSLDEDGVALPADLGGGAEPLTGSGSVADAEAGAGAGVGVGIGAGVGGEGVQATEGVGSESGQGGEREEVLLPGLCVLLEVWLREVVSLRFRDTCTEPVVLGAYFDSPDVIRFLEKLPEKLPEELPAKRTGGAPGAEAGVVGTRLVTEAVGALKQALQLLPQQMGPLPPAAPGTPGAAPESTDPWNNWSRAQNVSNAGGSFSPVGLGGVLASPWPAPGVPDESPARTSFSGEEEEEEVGGVLDPPGQGMAFRASPPLSTPAPEGPGAAYTPSEPPAYQPQSQEPRGTSQTPGAYAPGASRAPQDSELRSIDYDQEAYEEGMGQPYKTVSIPREGLQDAVGASDGVPQLTRVVAVLAAAAASVLLVYQATTGMRRGGGAPAGAGAPAVSSARGAGERGARGKAGQGAPSAAGGTQAGGSPAIGLLVKSKDTDWGFRLIQNWQLVKADALGPEHRLEGLREVLGGQMLDLWEERAREVQANGWYWEYSFISLDVESVLVAPDRLTAVLVASIQEAARLVDGRDPAHNDSYRSTYKARYELRNTEDGWRITGGTVLR